MRIYRFSEPTAVNIDCITYVYRTKKILQQCLIFSPMALSIQMDWIVTSWVYYFVWYTESNPVQSISTSGYYPLSHYRSTVHNTHKGRFSRFSESNIKSKLTCQQKIILRNQIGVLKRKHFSFLKVQDFSARQIAAKLNRSRSVPYNFLKNTGKYGRQRHRGKRKK